MPSKQTNTVVRDCGDWLEVDISTPKFPDAIMKIGKADWGFLIGMGAGRVFASLPSNHKYPYASVRVGDTHKYIHRLLLQEPKCIDHVNRNGLDNRRCNIRACTRSENNYNQSISTANTSRFKGASWYKKGKKWQAQISCSGKVKHLGYFNTPKEAHAAYCAASEKYHGGFGRVN